LQLRIIDGDDGGELSAACFTTRVVGNDTIQDFQQPRIHGDSI